MAELQLFRITLVQTWSAESEALVMAKDKSSAITMARTEVEFDLDDANDDGQEIESIRVEPLETILSLNERTAADLWLILPDGDRLYRGKTVDLAEFQSALSPERVEQLRIARMEANNGQLALLEVTA